MQLFGSNSSSTHQAPVLVHSVQSSEAFDLAQQVWQNNSRGLLLDSPAGKEFVRLSFSNPDCTVWLQRDQGRTDTFELILSWHGEKQGITEIYVLSVPASSAQGDDTRVKSLLSSILSSPAIVPINPTKLQQM